MYWNIGKYIDKVEQDKNIKTILDERIIQRLSKDLTARYGKGFSATNLKNMRLFFRTYSLSQISDRLEWSNYVALLTVKDPEKRQALEKRIINERLTNYQLRRLIARDQPTNAIIFGSSGTNARGQRRVTVTKQFATNGTKQRK